MVKAAAFEPCLACRKAKAVSPPFATSSDEESASD
jgi:hypothetical protein